MRFLTLAKFGFALTLSAGLLACSNNNNNTNNGTPPPVEPPVPVEPALKVGAASRSILPTVDGSRFYLEDVPGWALTEGYEQNPGVYIPYWDQGQVDVGNGEADSAWVHDDIRVTAIALEREGSKVVLVGSDTYMHFAPDIDKIVAAAKAELPAGWADADILINASHNHQGPGTAFAINTQWYEMASAQFVEAISEAVDTLKPATTKVATGMHGYGTWKDQAPYISDERLNVLAFNAFEDGEQIATMVQWAAHPETTLNMKPDPEFVDCPPEEDNCDAEGRYFSADYAGTLQARLKASHGGEVLFLNGALLAVTTLNTPVWKVTEEHPVGTGKTVPEGAEFVQGCDDYRCKNFAVMENIGTELYNAVVRLMDNAEDFEMTELSVSTKDYFTKMTNLGFSYVYASGDLGWYPRPVYICEVPYSAENCVDTEGETIGDPLGVDVMKGNIVPTRFTRVDFGPVGMMYMPGELSPELVIGLPDDFDSSEESISKYYGEVHRFTHAAGDNYMIPGALLSLADEEITFTVGLGDDQLGYHVVLSDYRLECLDPVLDAFGAPSCAELYSLGAIDKTDWKGEPTYWVSGVTCKAIDEKDPDILEELGVLAEPIAGLCRYGQMLGQAEDHYHETNGVGWDAAADLFKAAKELY